MRVIYGINLVTTTRFLLLYLINFAWDVGIRDAHFECDSLVVCDAVRGLSTPLAGISNIVSSMCLKLQDFHLVQVSHVKRSGNRPAHILAQYARDLDSYVTWIEENSVFLEFALAHDVLNLSSLNKVTHLFII